jgi:hypothetical protein
MGVKKLVMESSGSEKSVELSPKKRKDKKEKRKKKKRRHEKHKSGKIYRNKSKSRLKSQGKIYPKHSQSVDKKFFMRKKSVKSSNPAILGKQG